jgi:anti-anti-sigma factor
MPVTSSVLTGGIGLIEVKGTLINELEVVALRNAVNDFVGRHWRRLLIDLTGTSYVNSSAIGVFVSAYTSYTKRQWQIKVCGVNKNIGVIFAITKLTQIFTLYESREEAIKSFS